MSNKYEIEIEDLEATIHALRRTLEDAETTHILLGKTPDEADGPTRQLTLKVLGQLMKHHDAEWREIPDFEDYEMRRDGSIRKTLGMQEVRPHFDLAIGKIYNLSTDYGTVMIHVDALHRITFPAVK